MYKKLVVGGGGARGYGGLGALSFFDDLHQLDNIKEYFGTSIGAVIILLLSIGYKPIDIFQYFLVNDVNITDNILINIENLKNTGLIEIDTFTCKMKNMIIEKVGFIPTFQQHYDLYKKKIHIIGTNIDKLSATVFNVDNFPEVSVLEAVEISCGVPLIFTKKYFNNELHFDGGCINNYPIDLADSWDSETILGIHLVTPLTGGTGVTETTTEPGVFDKFNWVYKMLLIPLIEIDRLKIKTCSQNVTNINIVCDIGLIKFFVNKSTKLSTFSSGYQQAKTIYESRNNGWEVDF